MYIKTRLINSNQVMDTPLRKTNFLGLRYEVKLPLGTAELLLNSITDSLETVTRVLQLIDVIGMKQVYT